VYVDFRETDHLLVIRARLGSRLPAFCTSSGHVLLSGFTNAELEQRFAGYDFEPPTPHSVASLGELTRRVDDVRAFGYALVDQEVADGHRSSAAPVHDHTGQVAASISISVPATRVSMDQLRSLTERVLLPQTRALSFMLGYKALSSDRTG
jgi:IclR family pca regulon transcriptional regulator